MSAAKDITALIKAAFANTEVPRDRKVLQDDLIPGHPETKLATQLFVGRSWQDVTCEELGNNSLTLLLLSPFGAAYFAPKIILCSLKEETNPNIFDWHDSVLLGYDRSAWTDRNPEFEEWKRRYHADFISCFTTAQARAIARYVKYLSTFEKDSQYFDVEAAALAYQRVWKKYDDA